MAENKKNDSLLIYCKHTKKRPSEKALKVLYLLDPKQVLQ